MLRHDTESIHISRNEMTAIYSRSISYNGVITMPSKLIFVAAIFIALTGSAFADVKIKSKQTMSGQTYENTTYIKGKRQRTESMNGMMINLTQCDLRRGIQLSPQTKTYVVNPFDDGSDSQRTRIGRAHKSAGGTVFLFPRE